MATMRASEERTKRTAAESRAEEAENLAAKYADRSLKRGLLALFASLASTVALVVVVAVAKSIRSFMSDDVTEAIESSQESTAALERRMAAAESDVKALRTEISEDFRLLREQIAETMKAPPEPQESPKPKRRGSR